MTRKDELVEKSYRLALERFSEIGVDTEAALQKLQTIAISLHCWQGDDVGGFENLGTALGGGLAVTGNYPGKARTPDELRSDLELAYSLIPGRHRLNLHACYGEFSTPVDRDQIGVEQFTGWMDWSREQGVPLDFNPTYFAHEKAADGFTLSHVDAGIRQFWIEHGIACRQIAAAMGQSQGSASIINYWVPDGYKDIPVDRSAPRERLSASLDQIFAQSLNPQHVKEAVESKLFGIGSESYVVGSHEFYLGYALSRGKMLCLDAGHFHPTEVISDKISSVLLFSPELLLHVSRGVRWDSDHVVTLNDDLQAIAQEIVRGNRSSRVHIGLDFFDASINRIAAWVIGTRNLLKALLMALLEPASHLQTSERGGDFTTRLAMLEEHKLMPIGAVWDYYCLTAGVPHGSQWLSVVKQYEQRVLSSRSQTPAAV